MQQAAAIGFHLIDAMEAVLIRFAAEYKQAAREERHRLHRPFRSLCCVEKGLELTSRLHRGYLTI